jgi:hypothetical protein
MDCYYHALEYRKHLASPAEVFRRYNELVTPSTVSAVVFAFATASDPEFALVCKWGDDPRQPARDMNALLTYGDPIGVVRLAPSRLLKDSSEKNEISDFVPFAGHEWASEYSAAILDQAYHTMPFWHV